jgi:hypothetical protein
MQPRGRLRPQLLVVCLAAVPGTAGVLALYHEQLPGGLLAILGFLAPVCCLGILGSLVDLRIEGPLPLLALVAHLAALGWSLAGSFGMWMTYQAMLSRI